jgi:AraC-like DNA-binding protein
MSFLVHYPAAPLSAFVECFYTPAGAMPYVVEKVMPAPYADLKINFGEAFQARRAGETPVTEGLGESWCMGIWDEFHTITWPGSPDFVGVRFRPGGAFAVLGVEPGELVNRIVALDAVLGRFAGEVRERLYEAGSTEARFAVLETLLTAAIRRRPDSGRIAPALKALEASHGHVAVADLVRVSDMSQKHLITLFNRLVGVPPKTMGRLYRMQHVIDTLNISRPVVWTEVAQDHLYFDQAHFNKDFKRFTGHAPGEYLALRRRVATEAPAHAPHTRLLRAG